MYEVSLTLSDNEGKSTTGSEWIFVVHPEYKMSQPLLVTPGPATQEKIEWIFQTRDPYQNCYDPDEVKIDARVTTPDGDSMMIPCFFQVPAHYVDQEWGSDPDHSSWMLRMMTEQPGTHSLSFILEDTDGIWYSEPVDFEVLPGTGPGTILRDSTNSQFYRHSTGEPFYPLGINAGWNSIENYSTILHNLSSGGANMFRYWQTPFNWQALEWSENYYYNYEGLGRYNQEAAARTDSLLALCDSLDLYMQLCIFQHGEFSENVDEMWDTNPYNIANGGYVEQAEEYFYSDSCQIQTKKLLRYIIARWAYATHLFGWEFFNEVQFTGNHNNQSERWWPGVMDWHSEMSNYVASLDPYNHLMTTSAAEGQLALLDTISALDNLQYHLYDAEETLLNTQVGLDRRFLDELAHTSVINGEYGTRNQADTPFDMQRNAIWNGIMTQVPRFMWVWEHYLDPDWANLFSMPARFLAEEDLALHNQLAPYQFGITHPDKTFRSLGLSGDTLFTGYLYDPQYGNDIRGVSLWLEKIPVANYTLSWWLPVSDTVITRDSLAIIQGASTLEVPQFSKGVAFKLKYHSAYSLPLANAGPDTVVAVGTPVLLSGKASSSPGTEPLSYKWKLLESPEGSVFTLNDSTSVELEVIPDLAGIYRLSLVVDNGSDTSQADEVIVRGSLPPVAVAGADTTVMVDEMYVRIDGSGSYDPDGDQLSFAWELAAAPEESEKIIYEATSHEVILKSDVEGAYILVLRVSDGVSVSAPDTTLVTVLAHGTGIEESVHIKGITLYPNPSSGIVTLKIPPEIEVLKLEILDLGGRILEMREIPYSPDGLTRVVLTPRVLEESMVIFRVTGSTFREELLLLISP